MNFSDILAEAVLSTEKTCLVAHATYFVASSVAHAIHFVALLKK